MGLGFLEIREKSLLAISSSYLFITYRLAALLKRVVVREKKDKSINQVGYVFRLGHRPRLVK